MMNPWSLVKERGIKRLLIQLQERLGPGAFELLPRRADVAEAVTICRPGEPGLAAFIFTYGQAEERYGVHLAYPYPDPSVPESVEDLTAARLVELLAIHFEMPPEVEEMAAPRVGYGA